MLKSLFGGFAMAGIFMLIASIWLLIKTVTTGCADLTIIEKAVLTIAAFVICVILGIKAGVL
jgi:hypothetical protein